MQQQEKIFADGFSFKRREGAPDFVIGRQSIKVDEAIAFLKANVKNGWVNLDVKQSKSGSYYCELDTWEASPQAEPLVKAQGERPMVLTQDDTDELPF
jgi:hypothetical protein